MEGASKTSEGESSSSSTAFLQKGKSDSLVPPRWTSLSDQNVSMSTRFLNRKSNATHLRSSNPLSDVKQRDGDHSHSHGRRISRTMSANLSLGVAGPLVFLSDHAVASVINGREEEQAGSTQYELYLNTSDDDDQQLSHAKQVVASSDNFKINIHHPSVPPPPPISLKFVDVKYKVRVNEERSKWMDYCARWVGGGGGGGGADGGNKKRKLEKKILKGVTGEAEAGEVLALMGPSGSGKTTLINLLSGRLLQVGTQQHKQYQPHLESGSITYNDMPYSKALKPRMGFVTQDDVLYPHLTVKETLVYAALLRLSKKLSKKERTERAMEVISELGLDRCQETIIGGPFLRGVSGGERKRVCIGQEILIDPSLLFLDEPTSGLDSTTAVRIIKLLQKIAQGGRTVVTTIHQPSSKLFHMFDKLVLLSEGHLIYYGMASIAMDYFSSIGFAPQLAMNPAEFLLDLASGSVIDISMPAHILSEQLGNTTTHATNAAGPMAPHKAIRQYLSKAYEAAWDLGQKRHPVKRLLVEHESSPQEHHYLMTAQETRSLTEREWGSTWWSQFEVLYVRGLRERRHEYLSYLRVSQVVASAFIIGCLWWRSSFRTERQLVDQVGLLFFIATYWGFFPLFTALFTFPQERAILTKERASDMYRLSAYFMARTLGDIPLDFCLPFLFHIIVYFMACLRPTASAFFLTLLIILLSTTAAQGMGIAMGAIFMDLKKATTLASVALLTFMLSGGFFVQRIPSFISWIQNISYNYHTFKLLVKVQYDGVQQYDCATPRGCQTVADSTIFKSLSLDGGHTEALALLSMVFGYRLLAYVALKRTRPVV